MRTRLRWLAWLPAALAAALFPACGSSGDSAGDVDADVADASGDEPDVPGDGDGEAIREDGDGTDGSGDGDGAGDVDDDGGGETGDDGEDGDVLCLCTMDADCQDDSFCNGEEQCVACECRPGIPESDGTVCNDGDACTDGETCAEGACGGGAPICECDVDDDCTPFDDDDLCNGRLVCVGRRCLFDPGTVVFCDPSADTDC